MFEESGMPKNVSEEVKVQAEQEEVVAQTPMTRSAEEIAERNAREERVRQMQEEKWNTARKIKSVKEDLDKAA